MFEQYYQTELSYLREMGREFANKHPALAGMLAERGVDPDVERLLEGFAFVAARLRQRIDDSHPELIEALCELLFPHVVRPTPACTIVEFQPMARSSRARTHLEAGKRVLSKAVRGTACTFVTTRGLDLAPLRVLSSRVDESSPTKPTLTVQLEVESGATPAVLNEHPLRLHLHGEYPITTQLYLWFTKHLTGVSLVAEGHTIELPPGALRPVGFTDQDTLFPWPAFSPHGVRLLLEYFALPAKFLFFDLFGLERGASLTGSKFALVFRFSAPPPLPSRLPEDTLRLHCVPAVNLFETDADPIRLTLDERPVLLRAAGLDPGAMEVFSVQRATGITKIGERRNYEPFHSFQHALAGSKQRGFYTLSRRPSPVDDGVHTHITVQSPASERLGEEVLSVNLLCTNRSLTGELQLGDVCTPTADIPAGMTLRNIGRISLPVRPALADNLPWSLLGHLACSRRTLSDANVLRSLLALYCTHDVHHPVSRANRAKIDAIRGLGATTITRAIRGIAASGSRYTLDLDETGFASIGDAFVFGQIIHGLLQVDARLNTFADLSLRLQPSELKYRYDAELAR